MLDFQLDRIIFYAAAEITCGFNIESLGVMRGFFVLIILIVLYVAVAGIIPAILLAPEECHWAKTLGGALLAMLAPISVGGFIGFQLSLKESGDDFGTKLVRYVFVALAGASLAQYEKVWEIAKVCVIECATRLSLDPVILLFLFPIFTLPAWYLGYQFNKDGLEWLLRVLENFLRLMSRNRSNRDAARFELGQDFMNSGKNKFALAIFREIVNGDNFEPTLSRMMAKCYHRIEDFDNAMRSRSKYLQERKGDKQAIKEQIMSGFAKHSKCSKEDEKAEILITMQEFATTAVDDGVLTVAEINEIWAGLISEVRNGTK